MLVQNSKLLIIALSIVAAGGLGFFFGRRQSGGLHSGYYDNLLQDYDPSLDSVIRDDIDIENIKNHLK